jgi:predicted enzyme related to lactoylglutathione lyase
VVGIVWWEIETPDPEAFMVFHASLWGWSFRAAFGDTDLGADYWVVSSDGQVVGGLERRGPLAAPPSPGPRLYLEVADLEDALDRVGARGGQVERGLYRASPGGPMVCHVRRSQRRVLRAVDP